MRAVLGTLAGVIFLRVLGVSLLLPGFVEFGRSLGGSTFEAGLAFGAYPFALALFMLPLGALSDRLGRRGIMAAALGVSAVGGFAAAFAPNVFLLAVARFVQGAGAVNAVALAVVAEVGEPEKRTRRMAVMGAAAGGGFVVGLLIGAWLHPLLGVPGLLILHSVASLALVPAVYRVVPARREAVAPEVSAVPPAPRGRVLRLGLGGLGLNLALTGLLFLSPLLVAVAAPDLPYGLVLTLMILPGGFGMFLAARFADRGHARAVGVGAALLLGIGPLAFLGTPPLVALLLGGVAFFIGHSSLSSLLPSLGARIAGEGRGGSVQGVLSTMQYAGSAVGAMAAGALYPSALGLALLFLAAAGAVALAVVSASGAASSVTRTVGTKPF